MERRGVKLALNPALAGATHFVRGARTQCRNTVTAASRWLHLSRSNAIAGGFAIALIGTAVPWWCASTLPPTPTVSGTPETVVVVGKVEAAQHAQTARFSGELRAQRVSSLAFTLPGRIAARQVELGDRVGAGAPLLLLDRIDLERQALAARASVERTQVQVEHGALVRKRMRDLAKVDATPLAALDDAVADERIAKASRKEARMLLERARYAMDEGVLRAPFEGVVTRMDAEVGEHVNAGEVIVEVADDEGLVFEVDLPETWVTSVAPGSIVTIVLPMLERRIAGTVRAVGSATRRGGLYPIVIDVVPDPALRPGLTAELLVELQGTEAFSVPVEAVVHRAGSAARIYLVESGIIRAVDVTVLGLSGRRATIQGDLTVFADVVTRGLVGLYDGKAVEVRS